MLTPVSNTTLDLYQTPNSEYSFAFFAVKVSTPSVIDFSQSPPMPLTIPLAFNSSVTSTVTFGKAMFIVFKALSLERYSSLFSSGSATIDTLYSPILSTKLVKFSKYLEPSLTT